MGSTLRVAIAVSALLGGTLPAWAQSTSPVTVTPYIAFGTEGVSPIGVAVTVPISGGLSAESETAYRRGEGDLHAMSASLSLLQDLPKVGRVVPYVALGAGMAQYGEPVFGRGGAPTGTTRRLGLTFNAGAGMKVPLNSSVSFRTDLRYFDGLGQLGDAFRIANGISFGTGRKAK